MARKCIIVHPKHPMVQPKPATFCQLPMEILHGIASHMEPQELLMFEQASKRCRQAASDDNFWKELLHKKFGWVPDKAPPSWRMMYRLQHEFFHAVILQRTTMVMASQTGPATLPRIFMPPMMGMA